MQKLWYSWGVCSSSMWCHITGWLVHNVLSWKNRQSASDTESYLRRMKTSASFVDMCYSPVPHNIELTFITDVFIKHFFCFRIFCFLAMKIPLTNIAFQHELFLLPSVLCKTFSNTFYTINAISGVFCLSAYFHVFNGKTVSTPWAKLPRCLTSTSTLQLHVV